MKGPKSIPAALHRQRRTACHRLWINAPSHQHPTSRQRSSSSEEGRNRISIASSKITGDSTLVALGMPPGCVVTKGGWNQWSVSYHHYRSRPQVEWSPVENRSVLNLAFHYRSDNTLDAISLPASSWFQGTVVFFVSQDSLASPSRKDELPT